MATKDRWAAPPALTEDQIRQIRLHVIAAPSGLRTPPGWIAAQVKPPPHPSSVKALLRHPHYGREIETAWKLRHFCHTSTAEQAAVQEAMEVEANRVRLQQIANAGLAVFEIATRLLTRVGDMDARELATLTRASREALPEVQPAAGGIAANGPIMTILEAMSAAVNASPEAMSDATGTPGDTKPPGGDAAPGCAPSAPRNPPGAP